MFSLFLSLSHLFFFEVVYYLKTGASGGNYQNQNPMEIGFCYRNCVLRKRSGCNVLHVHVERVMMEIKLPLMEPHLEIKQNKESRLKIA
jgi:hypothetical protein